MRLIRRPGKDWELQRRGCVATIGVFDGLHLGHQLILHRVLDEARRRRLPSLIFSFEPTPREYFSADSPPARLMRFREKFEAFAALGIDCLFCHREVGSPPFNVVLREVIPGAGAL
jgi:riboflavin kinase/FMN adenylyltransferase